MSEQDTPAPDAVTPLYGAPVVDEDQAVTITAPWHHAGPTGAVESPPVEEIRPYETTEDGRKVVDTKVLTPPTRPTRKAGRQAEAKRSGARIAGAFVDEVQTENRTETETEDGAQDEAPAEPEPEA